MKFNCIKCGKYICNLDLGKVENREEDPSYCNKCLNENLEITRGLLN